MVKNVLTGAGFIEGLTFKETRFITPPRSTYAIYLDSYERRGSDDRNLIKEHGYTIELYSYTPDPDAEKRIEDSLDRYALDYTKNDRYWLNQEQLYQVVYDFDFIEK